MRDWSFRQEWARERARMLRTYPTTAPPTPGILDQIEAEQQAIALLEAASGADNNPNADREQEESVSEEPMQHTEAGLSEVKQTDGKRDGECDDDNAAKTSESDVGSPAEGEGGHTPPEADPACGVCGVPASPTHTCSPTHIADARNVEREVFCTLCQELDYPSDHFCPLFGP